MVHILILSTVVCHNLAAKSNFDIYSERGGLISGFGICKALTCVEAISVKVSMFVQELFCK